MNTVIKPNTYVKILSQEHLTYIKSLAEDMGYSRWGSMTSESNTKYINFHGDKLITLNGSMSLSESREIFIPLPEASPKPPFKIRNANHPAVRQWLKGQGYSFENEYLSILETNLDHQFSIVKGCGHFFVISGEDFFEQEEWFDNHSYPELTLNLAVTSWGMPEPIDKDKLERMERIKAIEAELDKLKQMDA